MILVLDRLGLCEALQLEGEGIRVIQDVEQGAVEVIKAQDTLSGVFVITGGLIGSAQLSLNQVMSVKNSARYPFPVICVYSNSQEIIDNIPQADEFVELDILFATWRQRLMQLRDRRDVWMRTQKRDMEISFFDERCQITGLPNERRLIEMIETHCRTALREEKCLSALKIDFSQVLLKYSDSHKDRSLSERDKVFLSMASRIQQTLFRSADFLSSGNYGQFAILLPNTPEEGLEVVVSRIRSITNEQDWAVHEVDGEGILEVIDLPSLTLNYKGVDKRNTDVNGDIFKVASFLA